MVRGLRLLGGAFGLLVGIMGGAFLDVMGKISGVFTQLAKDAIGFDLSLSGLMEQAEKARRFFSELRDEMNYMSDKYGDTTQAVKMLTEAASESIVTQGSLKSIFSSLVDAGADVDKEMKGVAKEIGLLELKTGVAGSQFSQMSVKFEQMFKKKGIQKDILNIQKAMVGTGLRTAQLEQLMQGLTEVTEKLAFATRGETMDMKGFSMQYMETVGVLKKFGISAQTTTTFINNLLDPENIDKNMLLLNKMGYSYEQFNAMINSGKGSEAFFDKILNNIGDIAQEANVLEDAQTRYKYLKDTLGLPPEIAAKLLKVEPYRMREELKKIRKEMAEQEKQELYKQKLKAKEEKWQESMDMLRYEMVQPLVDLIYKNRGVMRKFAEAMKPIIQGLAALLTDFLTPLSMWFGDFSDDLNKLNKEINNLSEEDKAKRLGEFVKKNISGLFDAIAAAFVNVWNSNEVQNIIIPIAKSLGRLMRTAINYAKGNIIGERGWDEAEKNIKNQDLKEEFDVIRKRDNEYKQIFGTTERMTGYQEGETKTMRVGNSVAEIPIDNINEENLNIMQNNYKTFHTKLKMRNYRDMQKLSEAMVNNNVELQNSIIDDMLGKATDDSDKQFLSDLKRINISYLPKDLKISLPDNKYADPKTNPAGSGAPSTTPKFETKQVQESVKTAAAKMASDDFKGAIALIKKDPTVAALFAKEFAAQSTEKLNLINSEMQQKRAEITSLRSEIGLLNKKITEMEKSPAAKMLEILEKMQEGIFGGDITRAKGQSIYSLFFSIEDALTEDFRGNAFKSRNSPNSPAIEKKVFPTGTQEEGLSSLSAAAGIISTATPMFNNKYLENIEKSNIKSIGARQMLYLRGIAESTFSTVKWLKILTSGFIFTKDGLLMTNTYNPGANSNMSVRAQFPGAAFDVITGESNPYAMNAGKGFKP